MRLIYSFILAVFVFVSDQISKWYVTQYLIIPQLGLNAGPLSLTEWYAESTSRLPYTEIYVWPFFNFVMVWNHGISFGLFNQESAHGPLVLILLTLLITGIFLIWLFKTDNRIQSAGIALVIGGAIGNMVDRIRYEAVIDFLDFHLYGYHWPAFNIADSCIVVGIFILIVYCLFFESSDRIEEE